MKLKLNQINSSIDLIGLKCHIKNLGFTNIKPINTPLFQEGYSKVKLLLIKLVQVLNWIAVLRLQHQNQFCINFGLHGFWIVFDAVF